MTSRKPLDLRAWLFIVLTATVIGPLVLFGLLYTTGLTRVSEDIVVQSLKERGRLQAHALARQLYLPWRDITRLADTIRMDDPIRLRELLTRIAETDKRYVWLGVARTDGTVYAASARVREGQQVSGRHWFESGLHGPFAGDYHRDPGLAAMLPRRMSAKRMFDFAAPIRDAEGHTVGVLGAHFDWDEVRSIMAGSGADDTQTLLVDRNRRVLFGPDTMEGDRLRASDVVPGGRLEPTARIETWPDGKSYVTVTVPEIEYKDLPSFGWRLLLRQEAAEALQAVHWLVRHFWIALGAGGFAMLALIFWVAYRVAAPVRRLADFAVSLARGDVSQPPPDERGYGEARTLSLALTRLQAHLVPIDGNGQPRPRREPANDSVSGGPARPDRASASR